MQDGSNHRTDEYGGLIKNRTRLLLEVVDAITDAHGFTDYPALAVAPHKGT